MMPGNAGIPIDSAVRACMLALVFIHPPYFANREKGFPPNHKVIAVFPYGSSLWGRTARVVVRLPDGSKTNYFLLVSPVLLSNIDSSAAFPANFHSHRPLAASSVSHLAETAPI